jgi:C4-dicarboxylate transporter DctQ subunit
METFDRVMDRYVGKFVEGLTFLILGLLVAMIFLSVLSRYIFNFSLAWSEELAGLLFVWLTLLGSVTGVRKRSHMAIGFLLEKTPPEKRRWMNLYIHGSIVFFLGFMIWKGMEIFFATYKDYSAVLRIPIGLYYFSLPLCGSLMLLYASRDILHLLRLKEADQGFEGKEE